MKRRDFIGYLGSASLICLLAALAQQPFLVINLKTAKALGLTHSCSAARSRR
jgi:hypothetical protein